MLLRSGKSKDTFGKNVATETKAGKLQPQALAIAYNMQRKAKKMADGGDTAWESPATPVPAPKQGTALAGAEPYIPGGFPKKSEADYDKDWNSGSYAGGGMVENQSDDADMDIYDRYMRHKETMQSRAKNNLETVHEDVGYTDHGNPMYAEGGMAEDDDKDPEGLDMVERCMRAMYAGGGDVDDQPTTGALPAIYDYPSDLEFSYTGENSGDELSDDREDEDRSDMVSRVMKMLSSRSQRLPRSIKPGL